MSHSYTIEEVDFATIPFRLGSSLPRYVVFRDLEDITYCSTLREAQRVLAIIRSTDQAFDLGLDHFWGFE